MRTKSKTFKIVGKTPEGELVVRGMFEFADCFGFPVEMFCFECKDRGFIPDWIHFCEEAMKANWSSRRIFECIREGASVWGSDGKDYIVKRVSDFLKRAKCKL